MAWTGICTQGNRAGLAFAQLLTAVCLALLLHHDITHGILE
jgi:hypothetical protein